MTRSTNSELLSSLQAKVPLMSRLLVDFTNSGTLDSHVAAVVGAILDRIAVIRSKVVSPDPSQYRPVTDSPLEFFPNFKPTVGDALYVEDKKSEAKSETKCTKNKHSHATLLPGLFCVFCEHGISLGFSIMTEVESPRTPFKIFLKRFDKYLDNIIIIYDNACNLYEFSIAREPERFWNTCMFVDRLHMRDHTKCSLGFDLNYHKGDEYLNMLNSQASEQANSDLRNLSKAVTYMRPEQVIHHTALFLADRNRRKKRSLASSK